MLLRIQHLSRTMFSFSVNGVQNKGVQVDSMKDPPFTSEPGMNDAEFRRRGKEMIDYIADYLSNIK